MEIVLTEAELTLIKGLADEREAQNEGFKDAKEYAKRQGLPVSSRTAGRLGLAAEWAVVTWLGQDPMQHVWVNYRDENGKYPKGLNAKGDLVYFGRVVEVRNTIYAGNDLIVKHKDLRADALMVSAHVEMSAGRPTGTVFINGWLEASRGKRVGTFDKEGHFYRVSQSQLKKPFLFPNLHKAGEAA